VLFLFAGCGAMPTSPVNQRSAPTREVQSATMPIDDPAPPEASLPDAPAASGILAGDELIERAAMLPAALGGTVRNGRWRIEVPAGAVSATARFTVAVPSAKSGAVELGIEPAEMNRFATPVRLVADCHGVPPKKLAGWFISWYDPSTGAWVRVPGSVVDLRKKTVSAPLAHFSTYAVGPAEGKSGW
jgi:hypothetical protein